MGSNPIVSTSAFRLGARCRREGIRPAWEALAGVVDEVLPIDLADVEAARDMVIARHALSAREALHAAVMRRHGIDRILSFDTGFDGISGIMRIA